MSDNLDEDKILKTKELLLLYARELVEKFNDVDVPKEEITNEVKLEVAFDYAAMVIEHYRAIYELNINSPHIVSAFIPELNKIHKHFLDQIKSVLI